MDQPIIKTWNHSLPYIHMHNQRKGTPIRVLNRSVHGEGKYFGDLGLPLFAEKGPQDLPDSFLHLLLGLFQQHQHLDQAPRVFPNCS